MKKRNKRQHSRRRSAPPAPPRQVIQTISFRRAFAHLPAEGQHSVQHKITYLATDPCHPSLHVHRFRARPGMWICVVSRTYRIFYRCVGRKLILCGLGTHHQMKRIHRK